MSRVFPQNAEELKVWMATFLTVLEAHVTDFGMIAGDLTVAKNFNTAFATDVDAYASTKSTLADKSAARKDSQAGVISIVRPIVERINAHPAMTNELRSELGLRPRNLAQDVPTPIEELVPGVFLESAIGSVTVHWGPDPMNERTNGKPLGVKSANIYRRKAGETSFQLAGNATRSPYHDAVTGEGADYTYYVQYRGTKPTDLSNPSAEMTIAARGVIAA